MNTHETMLADAKVRYARLTEKVRAGVMSWESESDRLILLRAERDIYDLTRLVSNEQAAERRYKHTPRKYR